MAQSLDYIHTSRGMPWVKVGMHVEVGGKRGVIKGGMGGNLAVVFAGQKHTSNCHPADDIKYFSDDGSLLAVNGKLVSQAQG
jgi:hypothetical protein